MNLQLTLALRYLNGRKLRTILTTLAIVFGVLVVFGMNSMLPAFLGSFQANMMAVAGEVDATIIHKTGAPFNESIAADIQELDGVRATSGFLRRTLNLPDDYLDKDAGQPDQINTLNLVGLDLVTIQSVRAYPIVAGRFLHPGDQKKAVIHQTLADRLGIQPGDILTVPTASGTVALTVVGLLPAKTEAGNEDVFIPLDAAQQVMHMPGQINAVDTTFDTIDAKQREVILADIKKEIGENFQVGSLSSGDELLANIRVAYSVINLLGVLALFMGGFIIFNTFRTVVMERHRDIGMLRAVGASRRTILGLFLSEALLQGLLGTLLGLMLGYILALGLIAFVEPILGSFLHLSMGAPVVTPGILGLSVALGLGFTLLAGLIPALSASHVTPMQALRPVDMNRDQSAQRGRTFWLGLILMSVALLALFQKNIVLTGLGGVLFLLGILLSARGLIQPISDAFARLAHMVFVRQGIGEMASGNLSRQSTRTVVTASATMIGLAIVLMAASIVTSLSLGFASLLKKTMGNDFLIIPPSVMVWGSNMGAQPGLADDLRSLEGVQAVSTLRFAASEANGTPVSLLGIDPVNFRRISGLNFVKGDPESTYTALEQGRNLIANTALASTTNLTIGDQINLVTVDGEQVYTVVAIGMDYMNSKINGVFLSQANIAADFGMSEDVLLQVNLNPGVSRSEVEPQIRELLEPYPQFSLISGAEYLEQNQALMDTAFSSMYALLVFLAVPSLIAMLNTLAIAVIERTREIGMLHAVGATRRQIRSLVLIEALILAAIGTSFGLAAGLYLGYLGVQALATAGFPLVYLFPASGVVAAIFIGLLFGALAALIPARQAARMNVIAALRYE